MNTISKSKQIITHPFELKYFVNGIHKESFYYTNRGLAYHYKKIKENSTHKTGLLTIKNHLLTKTK